MVFAFLFFSFISHAHVIKDEVATTDKVRFSLKSVCKKMVTHEAPLVEILSANEIDCMGKKVLVSLFCEKEMASDPYYLRAYIDKATSEVVCQSGKKVIFKYQCVKLADKKLCDQVANLSCQFIREKLARRLDIVHSSFTKNHKGIKELNCYFESLPLRETF